MALIMGGADEWTVSNTNGLTMTVSSFGARLVELRAPDRNAVPGNVVLGFEDLGSYQQHRNLYLGATIGRVAGRIAGGRFVSAGLDFQLDCNEGDNHLHGGRSRSFDRVNWTAWEAVSARGRGVAFEYASPHLEEGYPGNLHARAEYLLSDRNELWTVFRAVSDEATPVNLTNHSYWNLGGGDSPITGHYLMLTAAEVLGTGPDLIPTGSRFPVADTALDYRRERRIGDLLPDSGSEPWPGLDHTYLLDNHDLDDHDDGPLRQAAVLYAPESGRSMELLTTEPALQVYSGNRLPDLMGRNGSRFAAGHALCLEPQHVPDSPALPGFPSIVLQPGQEYRHTSCYRFSTR
jgi:aldose 1-epimerase